MFKKVSEIDLLNPMSWEDSIFLTIDIDWAHDDVFLDTIDLVEKAGVSATWFITHDTPILSRLRLNSKFELGIHPNFNFLLQGSDRNGKTAQEVVDRLMKIVPEAKSVRSHCMTQSSSLLEIFKTSGLTHDCNHFIPEHTGIGLKPWVLWNEIIKVPYFWEDDVSVIYNQVTSFHKLIQRFGLKVFDFHPIHVFLNTENLDRYEQTRHLHQKPSELIKHRYEGYGTRNRLLELLSLATISIN